MKITDQWIDVWPEHIPTTCYYIAEDIGGDLKKIKDMRNWCLETLGPSNSIHHGGRWHQVTSDMIYFKFEKDRNWFILRWS